jgi:cytochrome c oxidase assembly protein subunit 11
MTESVNQKNTKLVRTMLFVVVLMFGFGYALVPLYDVLCDITGLNGKYKEQAVEEVGYKIDTARDVTVEFITALNETTPLVFYSEAKKIENSPRRLLHRKFLCGE